IGGDQTHDDANQFGPPRRTGSHDRGDPARLGGETHLVQIRPRSLAQGNPSQSEHASSLLLHQAIMWDCLIYHIEIRDVFQPTTSISTKLQIYSQYLIYWYAFTPRS